MAEVDYCVDYRFRAWMLLCSDITSMNLGHKAYYEYICRQLDIWHETGTRFLNPKGMLIDWSELTQDDIWGFLGKQFRHAFGPGRRISPTRMAIIDVFLKKKYPDIAASFDNSKLARSLANIHLSFFAKPTSEFFSHEFDERCEELEGIYISRQHDTEANPKKAYLSNDTVNFNLPIIIIRRVPNQQFCVVHRIEWPISKDIFDLTTKQHEQARRYEHWLAKKTDLAKRIYSGIGIPCETTETPHDFSMSIVLRDRLLKNPYITNIRVPVYPSIDDSEYCNFVLEHASQVIFTDRLVGIGKIRYTEVRKYHGIFSEQFINELFDLYETLGTEV